MEEYKQLITREAEALVESGGIAQRVVQLQESLRVHCAARQPSQVRATVDTALRQQLPRVGLQTTLAQLVNVTSDHVEQALHDFQTLSQWISLLIPKVADGNNFGVEVQLIVLKELKESSDKLQKAWDSMPDYHSQRATVLEKLNEKLSKETSTTNTVTATTGAKDGDEKKTVVATVGKETATAQPVIDDWVANVVAIDVKWYFHLARVLESVRDAYAIVYDRIDKNKDKILKPRGTERSGYGMY
ncbi:hypothetical protein P43SY_003033 [Pythium insidiosum]|uniref:Proteasome activator PA28 C-terminal domain-containing protein n=1 Tax=Pythium insidiosum TaxID=114742 RepID=A0AAD5MDE8_PYTIN|nr:hypothetical protein P43SY_003033 [Pythium insidiosum]KAJ0407004.1 hypothetical protein ATCC90586_009224 [Pythium insidiosum]